MRGTASLTGGVYTANASIITDLDDVATALSYMAGRCLSSGLDPQAYQGILRACFACGQRPWRGAPAWADDQHLFAAAEELRVALLGQVGRITGYTEEVSVRLAYELAKQADENGDGGPDPEVIADCNNALQILSDALPAFVSLANALVFTEHTTYATYEAAYDLVNRGHVMPHEGRFMSGDPASPTH